jgi:hypothetical protein
VSILKETNGHFWSVTFQFSKRKNHLLQPPQTEFVLVNQCYRLKCCHISRTLSPNLVVCEPTDLENLIIQSTDHLLLSLDIVEDENASVFLHSAQKYKPIDRKWNRYYGYRGFQLLITEKCKSNTLDLARLILLASKGLHFRCLHNDASVPAHQPDSPIIQINHFTI